MADALDLPLGPQDRLIDPPSIDHFNRESDGFAIELIPPDEISVDEKCSVHIATGSADGKRIGVLLERLEQLCAAGPIRRIVHGGGGAYQLMVDEQTAVALPDLGHDAADEAADRIHQIAEAALYAYTIENRLRSRSA